MKQTTTRGQLIRRKYELDEEDVHRMIAAYFKDSDLDHRFVLTEFTMHSEELLGDPPGMTIVFERMEMEA